MLNFRTDLAIEAKEHYAKEHKNEIDGVIVEEEIINDSKVTKVKIESEEGAKKLGKPIGNYITIDIPEHTVYDGELMDDLSKAVGISLKDLVGLSEDKLVLVVGLGNRKVTPDALGPKVVDKIMITRHLKEVMPDTIDDSIRPVCAIAPGVLGITGIETGEVIKALVDKIKPDMVICIDALASRRIQRVNRTIQISDTGISPGAGVNNHRMRINEETLGIKVIAIGVPTVVDAATIANDSIDLVIDELISQSEEGSDFYKMIKNIDKNEKSALIKELLNPYVGDLMVTPKEVDLVIDSLSKIISNAINIAIQPNLEMEDINKFMN
ncbi:MULTISPECIES: GPR endopeptidase [Clostridium]|uniref:Germination protease n=1 Tax=Clostridium nitritogenes TaxID=83340 RepID=A0ABP3WXL2_9CLOT|nr:GPR endopeptidase [Clostridium baratii]AQM59386.1 GPR endopeptidase [Clostridium baratii]KJU70781.1 peptidase [Clostridium baratii]MBS6042912.1 GPR endopeptidase [Clostridium baratii]MBT9832844.1 GPR endopeptidase [Clostridium baratii]MDY3206933.1 GPR endopeptidase [Clostridium baratii]